MRFLIGPILLVLANGSFSQANCNKAVLNAFIYSAQSLAKDTLNQAMSLSQCRDIALREQAVFWGIFYLDMTKQINRSTDLINSAFPFQSGSKRTPKDSILHGARRGYWKPLKDKLDSGDPDYLNDYGSYIVLAHSLLYNRKFTSALETYQQYLKLKPNDDFIDVEYIFALIWAGDYIAAEGRLALLKKYQLGPYLSKSSENAENLILEKRAVDPRSPNTIVANLAGQIAAQFKSLTYASGSYSQSSNFYYQDQVGGRLAVHQFKSQLDNENQTGLEVNINGSTGVSGLQLNGELGFFSLADDSVFGKVTMAFSQKDYAVGVTFDHSPLTLRYPVPKVLSGQMSQSVTLAIDLFQRVTYTGLIGREENYAPYEHHRLQGFIPIYYRDAGQGLYLLFPVEFKSHPKANPFYRTRPRNFYAAMGLRYQYPVSSGVDVLLQGETGLTYRNSRQDRDSYQNLLTTKARISAVYNSRNYLKWSANFEFFQIAKEEFDSYNENKNEFSLGVIYLKD